LEVDHGDGTSLASEGHSRCRSDPTGPTGHNDPSILKTRHFYSFFLDFSRFSAGQQGVESKMGAEKSAAEPLEPFGGSAYITGNQNLAKPFAGAGLMNKDRRFFAGLVGVAAIVTWLIWTGVSETMVYYLTPSELMARVESDPLARERGFRVSGLVVAGSHRSHVDELLHTFTVADPDNPDAVITVHFRHPLPDTFNDEAEVVMEGRYLGEGVFEATEVLTKCGSRYEAMPEAPDYGSGDAYGSGAEAPGAAGTGEASGT
jgi:cytochrome c-type biogenesis protein CcmE